MLEAAETRSKLPKSEYAAQLPILRTDLVNAQYDLRVAGRSVIVIIAGDDRLGALELYNLFHEWMDVRSLASRAWGPPEHGEESFPPFWRYWRALPPEGHVGIWLGGWLQSRLRLRVEDEIGDAELRASLERHRRFEATLAGEGVRVLKIWVHLSEREHVKRLEKANKHKNKGEWRLDEEDWRICDDWEAVVPVAEEILSRTGSEAAPWLLVGGGNERHRNMTAGRAVLAAMQATVADAAVGTTSVSVPEPASPSATNPLDALDLSTELPYEEYQERRDELQRELFELMERVTRKALRPVLVFEGWDAAGKGGVIRRITKAIDARDYRVTRVRAPTPEEGRYPYLWRFWRSLTPVGRMAIFDRSWYGRVLVERVEGLASEAEWRRAYDEINDFEAQLVEADSVLLKFFLHVDPDEQLSRFRARERTPYKKYKISEDDYRNREKRDDYREAVGDMVDRSHTKDALWRLVAANDKRWARVAVLETVCDALRRAAK